MKIENWKFKIVNFALALLAAGSVQGALVVIPEGRLTGGPQNRMMTISLASDPIANTTNIVFGPIRLQPTNGFSIVPLVQANYWLRIDGTEKPFYMPVPDSTNTLNAVDLIQDGLKHLVAQTNWVPAHALVWDPVVPTLADEARTNLWPRWYGKTTNNWAFFAGNGFTLNTNCWTYGLDFSGLAAGSLQVVEDVALITPMHGITSTHNWGGTVGTPVIFTGTNGVMFTNFVAGATNLAGDMELITFSLAAPSWIQPFQILPTNVVTYLPTNVNGLDVIWMRNNSTAGVSGPHMNLQLLTGVTPPQCQVNAYFMAEPLAPFNEQPATGGDSGSPLFVVLAGRPVFLGSVQDTSVSAPWVSCANSLPLIQAAIGTNATLQFADVTRYRTAFSSVPPSSTRGVRPPELPLAGSLKSNDVVIVERDMDGEPSTQIADLPTFLAALAELPGWPQGNGGGTVIINTNMGNFDATASYGFTGNNTHGGPETFNGPFQTFGASSFWGLTYFNSSPFIGNSFLGGPALFFGNPNSSTNVVMYAFHGLPLRIYAGTNMNDLFFGTHGPMYSVDIANGIVYGNLGGGSNLPLAGLLSGGAAGGAFLKYNGSAWAPGSMALGDVTGALGFTPLTPTQATNAADSRIAAQGFQSAAYQLAGAFQPALGAGYIFNNGDTDTVPNIHVTQTIVADGSISAGAGFYDNGVRISGLPGGTNAGDMVVYNGSTWVVQKLGQYVGTATSTNAAVTNLLSIPIQPGYSVRVRGDFEAAGSTNTAGWTKSAQFRCSGVTLTLVQSNQIAGPATGPGTNWNCQYVASGTNLIVQVTGDAVETVGWLWQGWVEILTNATQLSAACVTPTISSQPASVTCITNTTQSFAVTASGTATLFYQWQTNSVNVSDTTHWFGSQTATLWVSNVTLVDSNLLVRCIVTNACGSVTSSVVTLTVTNGLAGGCALTNGLAGYWAFDNNYNDSSGMGQTLTAQASPYFSPGNIFSAITDDTGGYANIADNATLGMGGANSFTISCWVQPVGTSALKCIIDKGTTFDIIHDTYVIYNTGSAWRFGMGDGAGGHSATVTDTSAGTPSAFTWYNLVATYDAPSQKMNLFVNGVGNTPTNWTFGTTRNAAAFTVGANSAGAFAFNGRIDEVVVWTNRAMLSNEVATLYADGKLALTPLTYCSGINARYTVFFNGDARFGTTGSSNSIPAYFQHTSPFVQWAPLPGGSWASNHNATIVNESSGVPPPSPPNLEQLDDWYTNNISAWLAEYNKYKGPGTNLIVVLQNGINDIYIMSGAPLYGVWTHQTIATAFTNWAAVIKTNGINVVSTTIIPQWGLQSASGDGSGMQQEQVRAYVNQVITNQFPLIAGGMDADPWLPTNNVPDYWHESTNPSELNDVGATNWVAHLNTLFYSLWP